MKNAIKYPFRNFEYIVQGDSCKIIFDDLESFQPQKIKILFIQCFMVTLI